MSVSETVLAVVMPAIIWVMVLAFTLAILLALDDGWRRLRRLHQVPCYRCRFHTGSPYLKCSVNPVTACSEAAIACRDYEPPEPGVPCPLPSPSPKRPWRRFLPLFTFTHSPKNLYVSPSTLHPANLCPQSVPAPPSRSRVVD